MANFILLVLLLALLFAFTAFSIIGGGYVFAMLLGIPIWVGACITLGVYLIAIFIIALWEQYLFKE